MKVVIDTNMLMATHQFGLNLFSEIERVVNGKFEILVPKSVINELKGLQDNCKGNDKVSASVALELAKKCRTIETEKEGDDAVIELAKNFDSAIATNDIELKSRARQNGIPIIYMRQKKYLRMD